LLSDTLEKVQHLFRAGFEKVGSVAKFKNQTRPL